jgi:hypothetical protein
MKHLYYMDIDIVEQYIRAEDMQGISEYLRQWQNVFL